METKELILKVARELFNEHSYRDVTIRMIAEQLDMSSGHLNYHFKKRIDIFETLYFRMNEEFETSLQNLPKADSILHKFKLGLDANMRRMLEYEYFWTDLHNLIKVSDKVAEDFRSRYEKRVKSYEFLLDNLEKNKIINVVKSPNERKFLIKNLIDSVNTWLYCTNVYYKADMSFKNENLTRIALALRPYLTRRGRKEFQYIFRIEDL